jgi:hypothetical protein
MRKRSLLCRFSALALATCPLLAQADNARDWQNTPIDMNFIFGYWNKMDSNTPIDGAFPVDGLSLDANIYILRLARSFDFGGKNAAFQLLIPYAEGDAKLDNSVFFTDDKHGSGMGDVTAVFASNIFGGPAVTKEEFATWQGGTFLSYALYVTAPTGDYDKKQVINIGANRWSVKPEIAFGTPFGPTWLELNAYVSFYTDNEDYIGSNKLEQRPLGTLEGHYSYTINRALWVSLDGTYAKGGETKVNGSAQDNEQENKTVGASLGFMLSPNFGGLVAYTDSYEPQSDAADTNIWTVRLQYVW